MKHYGNWKVDALILAAIAGLILLLSEGSTASATIMIKASGAVIAVCCYKAGGWLYRKGELGNIDDLEE